MYYIVYTEICHICISNQAHESNTLKMNCSQSDKRFIQPKRLRVLHTSFIYPIERCLSCKKKKNIYSNNIRFSARQITN